MTRWFALMGLVNIVLSQVGPVHASEGIYFVDDRPGLGRIFDGIGAISGGGATSKLLRNYNATIRDEILDYLFKPNFGASLHMLKVEIGGDSQSTDGVEASHMHTSSDLNFNRGYEWWLMSEAQKRNPHIKLYGLPWVFPGWLGGAGFNPYSNRSALVGYVVNWVEGAWLHHRLYIDYVGIWNERAYDTTYIKMLRAGLDTAGFQQTQVVVTDGDWSIVKELLSDEELLEAVGPIGAHYPGSYSPVDARRLGRPLWASEEYSATNDLTGGGCWARILCESYVNGFISGVVAWNLITSYYDNLPYPRSSLMVANQPWSGNYEVNSPIWASAHFTQFMEPGWSYLKHRTGVGHLAFNGSYVSLTNPGYSHLTIIADTLDPATSHCFYSMPQYPIRDQTATFILRGSFANIRELRVWWSFFDFQGSNTELFVEGPPVKVKDGSFSLFLPVNTICTLTTLPSGVGHKGSYLTPPPPTHFPSTYAEDFEGYPVGGEAYNLAQQAGSFEVAPPSDSLHGQSLLQVVTQPPIDTCLPLRMTRPTVVFGDYNWSDVTVQYDFRLGRCMTCATGIFLAARVDTGGCDVMYSNGFYAWASGAEQTLTLSGNHTRSVIYAEIATDIAVDEWHTLTLTVKGDAVNVSLDDSAFIHVAVPKPPSVNGFLAFGTEEFGNAIFDNLKVTYSKRAESPKRRKLTLQERSLEMRLSPSGFSGSITKDFVDGILKSKNIRKSNKTNWRKSLVGLK